MNSGQATFPEKKKAMGNATLREEVWGDLLVLPEEALVTVREFVLFQKSRSGLRGAGEPSHHAMAEKEAAFARLMTFKGTIDREIDIDKEHGEALDEKYKRSF
jgi:hypothetical protein